MFIAKLGKSNLIKIPKSILKETPYDDESYYSFEIKIVGKREKVRLVLRCTSGGEIYFPKLVADLFRGIEVEIRQFPLPLN